MFQNEKRLIEIIKEKKRERIDIHLYLIVIIEFILCEKNNARITMG